MTWAGAKYVPPPTLPYIDNLLNNLNTPLVPLSYSASRALPLSLVHILLKPPPFRFNGADPYITIYSVARLELFASWPNQIITLTELL